MIANTKFNLLDRAWTFGRDMEAHKLVEVVIDIISIDFNIENDGDVVPGISYKINTPLNGHDWFVSEDELFSTKEDFIEAMECLFDTRKFNFPKVLYPTER